MRRILYSDTTDVLNNYFTKICKRRQDTINKLTKMKSRISLDKNINDWNKYNQYIDVLIDIFSNLKKLEKLIKLKRENFETYDCCFPEIDLSTSDWFIPNKQEGDYKGSFYINIVNAMNYGNIRGMEYADAIKELGIRTCIYCNAEYMPIVKKRGQTYRCRFEADHFFSKDKRPFLSISFYNLLPSCPFCNKAKSKNEAKFYLYTNDQNDLSPFSFSLDSSSVIEYMQIFNSEKLKITFTNSDDKDDDLLKNHEKTFHINKLYQSFNDEAEEIIWKAKTMNDAYVDQLKKSFNSVFASLRADEIRYLYGFYDKEEDIHKRPLTKVKQDIAKQLGILKKKSI